MKLVNFLQEDSQLSRLLEKMGAELPSPLIDFSQHWKALDVAEIDRKLSSEGVDISINELEVSSIDGAFIYEGRRVLVYIRDQTGSYYNGELSVSDYRFHIVNCRTIAEFQRRGRFDKYVVSTRTDNQFLCNIIVRDDSSKNRLNELRALEVCKNCLTHMNYMGYDSSNSGQKRELHSSFNLLDYFRKYNGTTVSRPRFNSENQPLGLYPSNWPEISKSIRERNNWKCSKCKGDFSLRKSFLDTHHIDTNPGNCEESNLIPLCKDCHAAEHDRYRRR